MKHKRISRRELKERIRELNATIQNERARHATEIKIKQAEYDRLQQRLEKLGSESIEVVSADGTGIRRLDFDIETLRQYAMMYDPDAEAIQCAKSAIASDLAEQLVEQNLKDVKVVYTRKTDVFVELDERAKIANKAKADLFVSIHTNALPGKAQGRGSETYTLGMHRAADNLAVAKRENSVISLEKDYENRYEGFDPKSSESYIIFEFMQDQNMEKSVRLATLVQKQFRAAGRPDKGVHQAGFLVLRATSMPSCLIELGYITTASEEAYLTSDRGVSELAQSIYQAIKKYKETQK